MAFQVGDLVVCVDASYREETATRVDLGGTWRPKQGGIYTIRRVGSSRRPNDCVWLVEDPEYYPWSAWEADRFRKLTRADDAFTATIRACRPVREQVPA